jgi:pimeloyl-[acyl-carrier protein] methyl ester esterase
MTLWVDTLGRGPDLVLLHGWGMHSAVWVEIAPRLAQRFRLHLVDLPGHGRSAATDDFSLPALASAILERIPTGTAALLGWSLGALVAQQIALTAPGRVRMLVLMSATPCFMQRQDWTAGMTPSLVDEFSALAACDARATLRRFVSIVALGSVEPKSQARRLRALLDERPHASAPALEAGMKILRDSDLRRVVAGLHMPACVIHGARDVVVPAPAGRWLAQSLPAARLHLLDQAGHAPMLSHAERIATIVIEEADG